MWWPAGNCTNFQQQFEKVFSVPGDVAVLSSTLVSPSVFNHTAEAYNITWYAARTGRTLSSEAGRTLVRGETLWFLNVTLDDSGDYLTLVRCGSGAGPWLAVVSFSPQPHVRVWFFTRTSTWCYKQTTVLVVEPLVLAQCSRPRTAHQMLTNGVNGFLSCPLRDCMDKLDGYNVSYSLKWYKVSETSFGQLVNIWNNVTNWLVPCVYYGIHIYCAPHFPLIVFIGQQSIYSLTQSSLQSWKPEIYFITLHQRRMIVIVRWKERRRRRRTKACYYWHITQVRPRKVEKVVVSSKLHFKCKW